MRVSKRGASPLPSPKGKGVYSLCLFLDRMVINSSSTWHSNSCCWSSNRYFLSGLFCSPKSIRRVVLYTYSLTGWVSTLLPRGTLQQLLPEFQQIFLVRIFLQTCINETNGLLTIIVTACTDAEGNQQTGFRPKSLHLRQ